MTRFLIILSTISFLAATAAPAADLKAPDGVQKFFRDNGTPPGGGQ